MFGKLVKEFKRGFGKGKIVLLLCWMTLECVLDDHQNTLNRQMLMSAFRMLFEEIIL